MSCHRIVGGFQLYDYHTPNLSSLSLLKTNNMLVGGMIREQYCIFRPFVMFVVFLYMNDR